MEKNFDFIKIATKFFKQFPEGRQINRIVKKDSRWYITDDRAMIIWDSKIIVETPEVILLKEEINNPITSLNVVDCDRILLKNKCLVFSTTNEDLKDDLIHRVENRLVDFKIGPEKEFVISERSSMQTEVRKTYVYMDQIGQNGFSFAMNSSYIQFLFKHLNYYTGWPLELYCDEYKNGKPLQFELAGGILKMIVMPMVD